MERAALVVKAVAAVSLFLCCLHVDAVDWGKFPAAPAHPTVDDCKQLASEHYENWVKPANDQYGECLQQKPQIELDYRGGGGECKPSGPQAWVQCVDLQEQACLVSKHAATEQQLCQQRALTGERAGESQSDQAGTAEHLEDLLNKGRSIENVYLTGADFISDPKAFLLNALLTAGQKSLLSEIFPTTTGQAGPDRQDLAQQAYDFAWSSARHGSQQPVISQIQHSALEAIRREYDKIFDQLDSATRQMNAFTSEMKATGPTSVSGVSSLPSADPARLQANDMADCALLDDFNTASNLRDSNENRFLELLEKCTR